MNIYGAESVCISVRYDYTVQTNDNLVKLKFNLYCVLISWLVNCYSIYSVLLPLIWGRLWAVFRL